MKQFRFESPNYTMAPNDLFDQLLKEIDDMSELKVTLAAVRMTIGYHVDAAELSIEYLHQMTGLARNSVRRGLALALRRGTIKVVKKSTNRTGGIYTLNVRVSAADSPDYQPLVPLEYQPLIPLKKVNKEKERNNKGAPPISETLPEETPKVNVYASYNAAFGEPIQNYGSPRTINAVEDLESFPGAWLDEAFLRTSKRERSTNEKWKEYQRFPYALQLLNEWRRAGGIQPEQKPKPPVYSPRREQFARPVAPAPVPKKPYTIEDYYRDRKANGFET